MNISTIQRYIREGSGRTVSVMSALFGRVDDQGARLELSDDIRTNRKADEDIRCPKGYKCETSKRPGRFAGPSYSWAATCHMGAALDLYFLLKPWLTCPTRSTSALVYVRAAC